LEVATSPFGMPLEHFLIDPPSSIVPQQLGLTPVGVRGVVDTDGIYQVLDWVGSDSYPKVSDFIDEAKVSGVSRRCEGPGVDYSMITPESRLLLVHSRAAITNWQAMLHAIGQELGNGAWRCQKHGCRCGICASVAERHVKQLETCTQLPFKLGETIETDRETARLLVDPTGCLSIAWHDFEPKDLDLPSDNGPLRAGLRKRPGSTYPAKLRPWLEGKPFVPTYSVGIFARLPIGGIAVVQDPVDRARQDAQYRKASAAHVPVSLVKE
jgi:hypothetical protein